MIRLPAAVASHQPHSSASFTCGIFHGTRPSSVPCVTIVAAPRASAAPTGGAGSVPPAGAAASGRSANNVLAARIARLPAAAASVPVEDLATKVRAAIGVVAGASADEL